MKPSVNVFWPAFWAGLGSSAFIYPLEAHVVANRTDVDAMRGDWERIGQDFKKVIIRESALCNS